MARIDDLTKEFMDKVSGKEITPPEEPSHAPTKDALKPIRAAKQVLTGMEDPRKALGKLLVRSIAGEVMDKTGSFKVLSLYQYLNDEYDREWWDWEPETLWAELSRTTYGAEPEEEVKGAVMALQLTLNANSPFEHWHIFEKVGQAFNFNPVMFSTLQPLDADEAALTMAILKKIRPKEEYDDEVLKYVAVCAHEAGLVYLPEDMYPGVQPHLDEITFEHGLRDRVKAIWESGDVRDTGTDISTDIQLSRLSEVKSYVEKGL